MEVTYILINADTRIKDKDFQRLNDIAENNNMNVKIYGIFKFENTKTRKLLIATYTNGEVVFKK